MRTQTLKLNKIYFLRSALSEITYRFFLICLGIIILLSIVLVKSKTAATFWSSPLLLFYTFFVTSFILSRVLSAILYKKSLTKFLNSLPGNYEPMVTFFIPCKNEERVIAKTVQKCFEVDYPKDKIEVILVNDGSTDNTLNILKSIQHKYENLTIINWEKNRGKRRAIMAGFPRARGEIIVQLDSDSYIDSQAFRNLIKPFEDPRIAAVSAHTDPENANENILTKMQAAYYFMSFRILKAAESTFMSVFCCSGCCSAYRKKALVPILDEWFKEKFLGEPVTWGEDRSLTTWLLKKGHLTIYNQQAQAYTVCPNNLKQLLTQQLRWKKSWIVNSIITSRFIYKKNPFMAFFYFYPLVIVSFLTPFITFAALVYAPLIKGSAPIYYLLGLLLITSLVVVYYRLAKRNNKYWPYLFAWGLFNIFILNYLMFLAALRLQDRGWGTRG